VVEQRHERYERWRSRRALDWQAQGAGMVELSTGTATFLFTELEG
jgi:hypothetical protein